MHRTYWYIIVFIVGFIGVSFMSFYLVTHPQEVAFEQTPTDFDLSPRSITLTTVDNIDIAGWYLPSEQNSEQALLLLHGYPAQKADLLRIASEMYPRFSLLLIDLRSFGDSGGTMTTFGVREQYDVRAAVNFLEDAGYEHIGIFGYSLGGALALHTAAQDERIDAVASYGSYADLRTLAHEAYVHLFILKYPLAELLNVWSRIIWGQWVFAVSPLQVITSINVPVFIGHAQNDDTISFHHAKKLAEKVNKNQRETFFPAIDYHAVIPIGLTARLSTFFENSFSE